MKRKISNLEVFLKIVMVLLVLGAIAFCFYLLK